MHPTRHSPAALLILAICCAASIWGAFRFYQQFSELSIQEIPDTTDDYYGGNDWVRWANTPNGVVAVDVHPLVRNNAYLKDRYIEVGDRLVSIEFVKIADAAQAEDMVHRFPTGKAMLYWVERDTSFSNEQELKDIILLNSYQPQFSFHEKPLLWSLFPWMTVPGVFLALVSLLIVFPILRTRAASNWPELAVLFTALLMFVGLLVRHMFLLVQTEYFALGFERAFTSIFLCLLYLYPILFLLALLKGRWKWVAVLPAGAGICMLWLVLPQVVGGQFWIYDQTAIRFTEVFFIGGVLASLGISIAEKWASRSRMDKVFHVVSAAYCGLLLSQLVGLDFMNLSEEFLLFLSLGGLFIPLISSTASQLKFGRVSLVLNLSIQYTIFFAIILGLYFLVHFIFDSIGLKFKYQGFLELVVLAILAMALRSLYLAYQDRFRRFFVLSQQDREEQIKRFISLVPQYASSKSLLEDTVRELRNYFGAEKVTIWLRGEEVVGYRTDLKDDFLADLFETLKKDGVELWSRNKQLSSLEFPAVLEDALSDGGWDLVNILLVRNEIEGLLLIGRKKRGVYNLGDMETISRLVQQTRLTLSVLHLLERERLLMEKNYEANLTALRSQINPHFLFNTLNTISSLIHEEPDEAEEAVEKLAFIFRYTLKHSNQNLVPMRSELSLVKTYLEIEKLRFGDRMEVRYEVESLMEEVMVPAFVVQTLIENCVKHGIGKIIGKGLILIEVWEEDGYMVCEIFDNGPGIDLSRVNASTGLNNILTRLEQIYQMKNLLYFENTGRGTRVTLKIPIQHGQTESTDRG